MIPDKDFLKVDEVIDLIEDSLSKKQPLSLVRVGDGENLILAQSSVWTIEKVLEQHWAQLANQVDKQRDSSRKGVTLPNYDIQKDMVKSLKKADIVGIPFWENDPIKTRQYKKRPLTEEVFNYFDIKPSQICHTFVNRVFTQKKKFWSLLKGKRVLLIGGWAKKVKNILRNDPYNLNVVSALPFNEYDEIEKTLEKVYKQKDDFDIVLLSCGVNAVILAQRIADSTGKIAIDFGKSFRLMSQKKAGLRYSSSMANKDLIP